MSCSPAKGWLDLSCSPARGWLDLSCSAAKGWLDLSCSPDKGWLDLCCSAGNCQRLARLELPKASLGLPAWTLEHASLGSNLATGQGCLTLSAQGRHMGAPPMPSVPCDTDPQRAVGAMPGEATAPVAKLLEGQSTHSQCQGSATIKAVWPGRAFRKQMPRRCTP